MELVIRGQIYERTLDRLHLTRDGRLVLVAGLRSRCATCGRSFEFTATEHAIAKGWVNRRCQVHKKPGSKVKTVSK